MGKYYRVMWNDNMAVVRRIFVAVGSVQILGTPALEAGLRILAV